MLMFETMLFLHLAGLVIWFGSLFAIAVVILLTKRQIKSNETKALIRKVIRTWGWLAHPTSILVLVSGIIMIVDMDFGDAQKPLWLNYMEMGGGMIIMLGIVAVLLLGSRMAKRLKKAGDVDSEVVVRGGVYLASLLIIIAAILSVILVVALRL